MPQIVRRAIPWLRIEPKGIYAFGTSMGGQEALLLAARHPRLLAGVAAFDPVTDMARRYSDFARLSCNRGCLRKWGDPIGFGLRRLAREEIGGTPRSAPRAYARRSPIRYTRGLGSAAPALVEQNRSRRQVLGPGRAARTQAPSVESRRSASYRRGLVAPLRGHAPVFHAHSRVEEVRPAGHTQAYLAVERAVTPSTPVAALAPRGARCQGKAVALVSAAGRARLRPRATPRLEVHRATRPARPAHRGQGLSQLCRLRRPDTSRRLLAAQPGVPQCDVRRLARIVVPVLG